MSNFDKKNLGRCEYLLEHDGQDLFDEVAYCPRMLNEHEKRLLLDDLSGRIIEFGENLELFLLEYTDVDMQSYYDRFYRKLSVNINAASSALQLRYVEPQLK